MRNVRRTPLERPRRPPLRKRRRGLPAARLWTELVSARPLLRAEMPSGLDAGTARRPSRCRRPRGGSWNLRLWSSCKTPAASLPPPPRNFVLSWRCRTFLCNHNRSPVMRIGEILIGEGTMLMWSFDLVAESTPGR